MNRNTMAVIIPTYRPGKEFREALARLKRQTREPEKLLIMNTEEKYWDPSLEEDFPEMEVVHLSKEEFDHGGTRKKAAERQTEDILVFMTQDALPADRRLLENLERALTGEERVAAVYARQLPKKNCSSLERLTREFNYPDISHVYYSEDLPENGIKTFFCSNVCAAYRKDAYEEAGGFPEKTIFNEDMILAGCLQKRGWGIAYAADARVYHSHDYTLLQQFHRNFDLGVSHAEYPEVFGGIRSEKEGVHMVLKQGVVLIQKGKFYLIPRLFMQSAAKYAGYRMGKSYRSLPGHLVERFTMNKDYWKS